MGTVSFMHASKLGAMLSADVCRTMSVRIVDDQLVLGTNPLNPTHVVNFSSETIGAYNHAEPPQTLDRPATPVPSTSQPVARSVLGPKVFRRSGDYWFEINGVKTECRSLKELLSEGLRALERARPGTLECLSRHRPRSKRIVARDQNHLFTKPELIENYSEQLMNGWWYGTNNSADETKRWLQRACSCAGLHWGVDFNTSRKVVVPFRNDEL